VKENYQGDAYQSVTLRLAPMPARLEIDEHQRKYPNTITLFIAQTTDPTNAG